MARVFRRLVDLEPSGSTGGNGDGCSGLCSHHLTRFLGDEMPRILVPQPEFDIPNHLLRQGAIARPLSADQVEDLLGPFVPVIKCLVEGEWDATRLSDIGVTLPGVETIPLGVEVCLDRACTDILKDAFSPSAAVSFASTVVAAMQAGGIGPIIAALGLGAQAGIVIGAGVTLGQVLAPAILVLAVHAAIVAGQLIGYDLFGAAPDGVCLSYPALPGIAAGVLNPVIGLVVLGNTPVIVFPR
jgi:hypothetical protein